VAVAGVFGIHSDNSVYASWAGEPDVSAAANDFFEYANEFARVTSVETCQKALITAVWAPENACYHRKAQQLSAGDDEVRVGFNEEVDGLQVRIIVIPHESPMAVADDFGVVKITGIEIEYEPTGRKDVVED
jgi:hypothetical protein